MNKIELSDCEFDEVIQKIQDALVERTQFVVFEPNDAELWHRVRSIIGEYLSEIWKSGRLIGATAEEAFFVACDRSIMTQNDIESGRLVAEVGISVIAPAEFTIFRIQQFTSKSVH